MRNKMSKADKHQQYLDELDRRASLFVTDRFAFELERKRILDRAVDGMDNHKKMRVQQKRMGQNT